MKTRGSLSGWVLAGGVLGAALTAALLPGVLPALTASIADETVYWMLARVGGFIAYGFLWLSVVFGLLLTSKVARAWPGASRANTVHQSFSIFALVYTAFHALILLEDRYIGFSLRSVVVPFSTATYRPLWVGVGQVAAYLLLIVTVSSYLRRRIGAKAWRVLHYITFVLFYLAVGHGLLAGSDSREPWALALYSGTGLVTYALTVYRVLVATGTKAREPKEAHVRFAESYADHHPAGRG